MKSQPWQHVWTRFISIVCKSWTPRGLLG